MSGLTWAKIFLLGLAAAAAFGLAVLAVSFVERRNAEAVRASLSSGGLDWVTAEADGLTVTLTGTAPDEASRFRALTVAGQGMNPDNIRDRMTVVPRMDQPDLAYELEVLRNGDSLLMHGLIPMGTDEAADIRAGLRALLPAAEISDIVTESRSPMPDTWPPAAALGLKALTELRDVRVEITPGAVLVDGVAPADMDAAGWSAGFRAAAPETVTVTLRLRQPRQRLSPFTLRAVNEGAGVRLTACAAETGEDAETVTGAVAAAGGDAGAGCRIALGAPNGDWAAAAVAVIRALDQLGPGAITISDSMVTVLPDRSVPPSTLAGTGDTLRLALPAGYRLSLVPAEPETKGGEGPRLSLGRDAKGPVTLRGPVSSAEDEAVLASLAAARFGAENLTRVISLDPGLPTGWDLRTLAATEALSHLAEGSVEMTPERITVRGKGAAADAARHIAETLTGTLGTEAVISVDVGYAPPPDAPDPARLPQICVERVNDVLLTDRIDFEPGAVELGRDALRTVDRIATVLRDCPDVRMEIGGHTDSQGREEMNQLLSQARAEAVLRALASRRVLVSSLSARGYGEAEPIADNGTEAGREANRRIAFRLIEAEDATEGETDGAN